MTGGCCIKGWSLTRPGRVCHMVHSIFIPPVRKSCIMIDSMNTNIKTHTHTHLLPSFSQLTRLGSCENLVCLLLGLISGTTLGPAPAGEPEQLPSHRAAVYPLWWVQLGWSSHIKWISQGLVLLSGTQEKNRDLGWFFFPPKKFKL